jgi:hypothetical protein
MNFRGDNCSIHLKSISSLFLCALGAFVLFQHPLYAQAGAGSGRIEGTVTDASGSVVPGALVTVREEATNMSGRMPPAVR